jgi:hypothetical protein
MNALRKLALIAFIITFAVSMQNAKKDADKATASAPTVVTQPAPEASFQSKLADHLKKSASEIEDGFFKKFGNKPFADITH